MNIFGFTPIDTALAAWGFNFSQKLTDLLFLKTPVGAIAFAIGFLWSLWQSSKEANFKYFASFIFIVLTGLLLFILPKRSEPLIKSAVEVYGTSHTNAQALKDSQTNDHTMPWVLSFLAQMVDSMSLGAISLGDSTLNKELRFLQSPFGMQHLSLQLNQVVHSPMEDVMLRKDVDDFVYANYLPSLIRYQKDAKNLSSLHTFWPGHAQILRYYSSKERSQWEVIQSRLILLVNQSREVWSNSKRVCSSMNLKESSWDDQIIASMVRAQNQQKQLMWLKWTGSILILFPYLYGWAHFCIYVAFPFLMLALVIVRRMSLLVRYIELFLWIKSWALCAACGYYISLMVARVQGQGGGDISWFWEYPIYVGMASVCLLLTPILTLIGIHQIFQSMNHRS